MNTVLLGPDDVAESAQLSEVIDAVEGAFGAYARGATQMPAKSYIDLPQHDGDFRSMPAYIDAREGAGEDWEGAGVKWVNSHPDNPDRHDLPTVMGTVVYSDPETALPLALMDGTELTRLRTGAAAAVATDYLARENATSLGLVGAGIQAHTQLEAVAEVRDVETVVVADVDESAVREIVDSYGDDYDVRSGSNAEAAACDVVSTTTPVRDPIVHEAGETTHVNAMGADAEGKHEVADAVLQTAKLVIDDYEQCTHSGEINVPWSEGLLGDDDLHGELGSVVAGDLPGRVAGDGVTVFDSTGLAIQDVAAAHVVYEHASTHGAGTEFPLIGTET
ncbi:MAG: L-alanine dehydrogenase [uncultured archaeon A07HR67]|jgi:Predicted ornithine cyclodeaminase, mu-crystallin homolog|nr:MAG: L-alanine dehydrogenase [uncultured archaeon A07HR67]